MKTILSILFLVTTCGAANEIPRNVPGNLKQIATAMPDKKQSIEIEKALNVVAGQSASVTEQEAAKTRLIQSGNEDLALFAITANKGSLGDLKDKKEWTGSDVKLLTRALLEMALPDSPTPGGEEQEARRGSAFKLGRVCKMHANSSTARIARRTNPKYVSASLS